MRGSSREERLIQDFRCGKKSRVNSLSKKTLDFIQVMWSIVCGLGVFTYLLSILRGNLLILSGPLTLWFTVLSFPRINNRKVEKRSPKSRRRKTSIKQQSNTISWRTFFAVGVWLAVGIALWPKISRTTISDSEVVAAMDRATMLFQNTKYKDALAQFWAIEIPECFPNRLAQKYHNIGLTQLKLGKPAEAEAALQKAIMYDPKNMDAYYLLARIAFDSRHYSKAMQYLYDAESQIQNGSSLPEPFRLLKTELEKFQNVL